MNCTAFTSTAQKISALTSTKYTHISLVRYVICAVKQMIRINHHDHCDCDPSHQQNYWIFRFVSLKFLNDAEEKIK